jgi:hypothetical protein
MPGVRAYLITAPAWVMGVVYAGVLVPLSAATLVVVNHLSWQSAFTLAVVGGVLLAVVIAVAAQRQRRRRLDSYGHLSYAQRGEALRWTPRRPPPRDPQVRAAALDTAEYLLTVSEGHRLLNLGYLAIMTALAAAGAITQSPWWGVYAVMFAVSFGSTFTLPTRMRRRIALLQTAAR